MKNGGAHGELAELEQQACEWIRSLQRDHGATATPLPERMRDHLAKFFPSSTIERARVCTVPDIPTPPFLVEPVTAGLPLLDFHMMAAFTAESLVLINPVRISGLEPTARAILFHEVVHVPVQRAGPGDLHARVPHQRCRLPELQGHPAGGGGVQRPGALRAEPGRGVLGGRDGAGDEAMERERVVSHPARVFATGCVAVDL